MSSKSPADAVKLCVKSEHDVADPETVQVIAVLAALSRQVKAMEFPVPGATLSCTVKFLTVAVAGDARSTFVSVVLLKPPPPIGKNAVPVNVRDGPEYVTIPAALPAAASAAVTNAVVASWVVLVKAAAVGAAGIPVKVGEASGAAPVT